ncbi:MAG: WD40/YVTN/BNR-like repeat-containing protein, partial [Gemmatimonadota bacterium]
MTLPPPRFVSRRPTATRTCHATRVVPLLAGLLLTTAGATSAQRPFDGLRFREIGPAVLGGRIHDVEVDPKDPSTIYLAAAGGGVWKTTNKGTLWAPIFDATGENSFGDLAVSPVDSRIVWAGTGEQNNRQSSTWGGGIYRSTDAGATWTLLGLRGTASIARVVAHPTDANIAYVAAVGNLWRPTAERGVYRTRDAGRSWERVLFVDTLTGATELVMDPRDPNVLYAATYQRLRTVFGFNGGGAGSAIYKTTDGGTTWRRLESGIPTGDKGRIGLSSARSKPDVLVAT